MAMYLLLAVAVTASATAVLASREGHHHGILKAVFSTGSTVEEYSKHIGSTEPARTETITAVDLAGRSGVVSQLEKQRHDINGSYTAQLTATGVLVLNSTTGKVVKSISPLVCSPFEFAEANGITLGSYKPIIVLVMCTGKVLAIVELEGQFVAKPYRARSIQTNIVAITMKSTSDSTSVKESTGLAFIQYGVLFHWRSFGSAVPVRYSVSSSLDCHQPGLSSLNSTHYLLVCDRKWYTVDGDANIVLIGSKVQSSKISTSENGEVAVSFTATNAEVRTNDLTQSCALDIVGLQTVDFIKVDNSILVLFFTTSTGVFYHNVITGCPSSAPSLLTTTAPVCLEQQECFSYYFTEGSNLLFITSRKSNLYRVEGYDMTSNTSLDINFVIPEPPLLLYFTPLAPLTPSPTPSSSGTVTSTHVSPSPSETPLSPNGKINTRIAIVASVASLVILGCGALALVITGLVICYCKRWRKRFPHREPSPARRCLSKESVESGESENSSKDDQVQVSSDAEHDVDSTVVTLGTNEQQPVPPPPIQEIVRPVQVVTDLSSSGYSHLTTPPFQQPPLTERGPNRPQEFVPTTIQPPASF